MFKALSLDGNRLAYRIVENKPLHNILLIVGVILLALGIALSCIPYPAALAGAGVTLTVCAPILLFGIVMTILRMTAVKIPDKKSITHVFSGRQQRLHA